MGGIEGSLSTTAPLTAEGSHLRSDNAHWGFLWSQDIPFTEIPGPNHPFKLPSGPRHTPSPQYIALVGLIWKGQFPGKTLRVDLQPHRPHHPLQPGHGQSPRDRGGPVSRAPGLAYTCGPVSTALLFTLTSCGGQRSPWRSSGHGPRPQTAPPPWWSPWRSPTYKCVGSAAGKLEPGTTRCPPRSSARCGRGDGGATGESASPGTPARGLDLGTGGRGDVSEAPDERPEPRASGPR